MQVKIFEAEDMTSGLKKVKKALGPDALILSTKTRRKKGLGFLSKPMIEITAAIDAPSPAMSDNIFRDRPASEMKSFPLDVGKEEVDEITYDSLWHGKDTTDILATEMQDIKKQLADSDLPLIHKELNELKAIIQGFAGEVADINQNLQTHKRYHQSNLLNGEEWLAPVANELHLRGVQDEAAEIIIQAAKEKLSPREIDSVDSLDTFFHETIANLLQVNGPILGTDKNQRRIALIGPTGVGKTTTIAKLAAAYLKNIGKKLVLVTIDTYRIAAVEQLKVYGKIMNVPVEVVMAPDQLKDVFNNHQDKELLLIDTAGRSPKDEKSIEELSTFLLPELDIENHLVLSSTAREQELHETVRQFSILSLKSFIFTKLDECETFGALLNVQTKKSYPLSYLTNGQRVPEDLILADPKKIAGLIMGKFGLQGNQNAITA